jgi:hypothetical protein
VTGPSQRFEEYALDLPGAGTQVAALLTVADDTTLTIAPKGLA